MFTLSFICNKTLSCTLKSTSWQSMYKWNTLQKIWLHDYISIVSYWCVLWWLHFYNLVHVLVTYWEYSSHKCHLFFMYLRYHYMCLVVLDFIFSMLFGSLAHYTIYPWNCILLAYSAVGKLGITFCCNLQMTWNFYFILLTSIQTTFMLNKSSNSYYKTLLKFHSPIIPVEFLRLTTLYLNDYCSQFIQQKIWKVRHKNDICRLFNI